MYRSLSKNKQMFGTTDFYTLKSKYLAKKMFMKPLPQFDKIKFIFKGNPSHYHYIRSQSVKFQRNQKIYAFHKEPIEIARYVMSKRVKQLTYITPKNYETVVVKPNNPQETKQYVQIKDFLKENRILIKKSFLDLHPLQAYQKLKSLIGRKNIPKSFVQLGNKLMYTNLSKVPLKNNTEYLKQLQNLRKQVLDINSQLKLQKLDKKIQISAEEALQYLTSWQQTFLLNTQSSQNILEVSQNLTTLAQNQAINCLKQALYSQLGDFVKVQQLIEGYGQNQYYAEWL